MIDIFLRFIPYDAIITALTLNVLINSLKPLYFVLMADVKDVRRDMLVIIVFIFGGALYSLLAYFGLFVFSTASCVLSPVLSVFFYDTGFYPWIVRTAKALLGAVAAKLLEMINAYKHKG